LVDLFFRKFDEVHLIVATLYMAANEIRASAKETGMGFWEYGLSIC
jgi:hypothetical protein